jgi:hypothetical protein
MARRERPFKGRQFTTEVILWAVGWYMQFPISYRDLELMLRDRGVSVDHTTIYRWIQAYAMELEKRLPPTCARPPARGGSTRPTSRSKSAGSDLVSFAGRQR